MQKLLFAVLFLFCLQTAQAQTKRSYSHSLVGLAFPDLDNLNNALQSAGLEPANTVYFARGAGFYATFPKARLAALFSANNYTGKATNGVKNTVVRSTQLGASLGILLSGAKPFQVIPFGGIAYSIFGARTARTAPVANTPFTTYVGGPPNAYYMKTSHFEGQAGLHLAKAGFGKSWLGRHLLLGIRGTYFFAPDDQKWKASDADVSNGPKINAGGFSTSIVVGLLN